MEIVVDGRKYKDYVGDLGQRKVARVQELLMCGDGCIFNEEFLREDGSWQKMCAHCDSTDIEYTSFLSPQDVPEEVLNRFGIEIDPKGFQVDTLNP